MKSIRKKITSEWVPEIVVAISQGYSLNSLFCDVRAGLLIAIVAFPLFMTFAIASGVAPNIGIMTCIVAGFLASMFGGARFQIVGPTGAFSMIVFEIIKNHSFEGMTCALAMAGVLMILFGLTKTGDLIHYIPYPITAGFTAGIGLSIIVAQLGNFFGLTMVDIPADFTGKIVAYARDICTMNPYSFWLALFSLVFLEIMQKYKPTAPRYFIVLIAAVGYSMIFNDVHMETIGSNFGDIANASFQVHLIPLSFFSYDNVQKLFPSAFAIAFLGSLESLLGAVITDNLSGQKHRSNMELIGQGIANFGSAIFGGIPATCALGTTAMNVKVGAQTPVAGLCNVLFIVLFMLCFGKYIRIVPMSSLAAMLLSSAWNMASLKKNKYILLAPKSDSCVFIATILITLLINIVVAVEIGLVLSAILFIKRSVETTRAEIFSKVIYGEKYDGAEVECVKIHGHLFFGAAPVVKSALMSLPKTHDVIYIDMKDVPFIDVSGAQVLKDFVAEVRARNIHVIIGGVNKRIMKVLQKMDLNKDLYGQLMEDPMV